MKLKAFTLIEILVVVLIISILAAIAVPNYMNAQTRAKISRAKSDLRAFDIAIETYILDTNKKPPTHNLRNPGYNPNNWWGYLSPSLTTPIAYLTTLPPMIFNDTAIQQKWAVEDSWDHTPGNQPCTYIRNTWNLVYAHPVGQIMTTTETTRLPQDIVYTQQMFDTFRKSGYVLYSCGPDGVDTTALTVPEFYDPTNGTNSFGDIYLCGTGGPEKPDVTYQPGHG